MITALFLRFWPHLLAVAALIGGLWMAYAWADGNGYERAEQKYLLMIAIEKAKTEKARADAQAAARKAERDEALRLAEAAALYEKQMQEASDEYERIIAAQRSGELRLRREWQGCEARLPGAPAAAGEPDGAAELRRTAAAAVVRVGLDCDARVRALQKVIQP